MPSPHLQLVRDQPPAPTLDEIAQTAGSHGVFHAPALHPGWTRIIVMDRTAGMLSQGELRTERMTDALLLGLALHFLGSAAPAVAHRSVG